MSFSRVFTIAVFVFGLIYFGLAILVANKPSLAEGIGGPIVACAVLGIVTTWLIVAMFSPKKGR